MFDYRTYRKRKYSYAWFYRYYWLLQRRAKQNNRNFDLSFDKFKELKSTKKCYYCRQVMGVVTIDRKNNGVGYNDKNCVAACLECNTFKREFLTEQETMLLAKSLIKIRKRLPTFHIRTYLKK